MYCFFFVFTLIFKEFVDDLLRQIIPLLVNGTRLYMKRVCSVCSFSFRFEIDDSFHEMRKLQWIKFTNGYKHRERKNQDELERVHEKNFENPKLMRQILTVYFW